MVGIRVTGKDWHMEVGGTDRLGNTASECDAVNSINGLTCSNIKNIMISPKASVRPVQVCQYRNVTAGKRRCMFMLPSTGYRPSSQPPDQGG